MVSKLTPVSTSQYQTISIGQLRELADSVKALGGLVQPIIARLLRSLSTDLADSMISADSEFTKYRQTPYSKK